MRMTAVFVVLAFVVAVTGVWAEVVVTTHVHTQFSDGNRTIRETVEIAGENGAQAVILSDHAEIIDLEHVYLDVYPVDWSVDKPRILLGKDEVGVANWVRRVGELYSLPLIPGMEVGLGETRSSHLLYWGGDLSAYEEVVELSKTSNFSPESAVQRLASMASQNGAVLVEAHPFNRSYPYTETVVRASGLTWGIEFFNGTVSEQKRGFERMVGLQAQLPDQHMIATGGADWHGDAYEILANLSRFTSMGMSSVTFLPSLVGDYDPQLWRRTIAVRCPDVSQSSIMDALRDGRCYAAFDGGRSENRILSASAMPGESFQPTPQNRIFSMQIQGLGVNDEVRIGVAGRDGQAQQAVVSGNPKVEGGVGKIAFDLNEICPREENCGWWLFVMTPEVVTSAIEILPWPVEQIAQTPPRTTPPVVRPPTAQPPVATPPATQDPLALISQYQRRYYGEKIYEGSTVWRWVTRGHTIKAWAGFDANWVGRIVVCFDGIWRDIPIQLNGDDGFVSGEAMVEPYSFILGLNGSRRAVWRSIDFHTEEYGNSNPSAFELHLVGDYDNITEWVQGVSMKYLVLQRL